MTRPWSIVIAFILPVAAGQYQGGKTSPINNNKELVLFLMVSY